MNGITNIEGTCMQMGKLVLFSIAITPASGTTLYIKHNTQYVSGFPYTTKFYNRPMGVNYPNSATTQPPCPRFMVSKNGLWGYYNGSTEYTSNAQPAQISMAYFAD
jgi:hypothetical protein